MKLWKATPVQNSILVLSDGTFFLGKSVGALKKTKGQLCFNVSMTGYQEVLTDPSYSKYIIVFTFPHIGNVGCNPFDQESSKPLCSGFVLRNHPTEASNFKAKDHFETWVLDHNLTGISGIDTRELTQRIRKKPQGCLIQSVKTGDVIFIDQLQEEIKSSINFKNQELADSAGTQTLYTLPSTPDAYHVVVLDYGVKITILQLLSSVGLNVTVVPAKTSFEEIEKLKPHGVFLSNGPGDPLLTAEYTLPTIKKIIKNRIPLFGICLGHQILALASNLLIHNMKVGHRGVNHPVQDLETKKVFITSQNHGFSVSDEGCILKNIKITQRSLFDNSVEGLERTDVPAFSVQYHPEASPGPHDSYHLFYKFKQMIKEQHA